MTIKGYPHKGAKWNNLDLLDLAGEETVGRLGRTKDPQSRSYKEKVQEAAEAYAWPDDIDLAPDFGSIDGFRVRMKQLAAFKAGVEWKEKN